MAIAIKMAEIKGTLYSLLASVVVLGVMWCQTLASLFCRDRRIEWWTSGEPAAEQHCRALGHRGCALRVAGKAGLA